MNYSISVNALKDKVILVTGAGDGIGKQAALSFAKHGASVILLGRTLTKLKKTYNEIKLLGKTRIILFPLDMKEASKQNYLDIIKITKKKFGRLDGLLNNASVLGKLGPFLDITENIYDEVMKINVKSQLLLTQAALPLLYKSTDASIIFTSSSVGCKGRAFWGSYSISKFATEGMMQILADELSNTTIRVNAINPGRIRTKMRAKAFPLEDPELLKKPKNIMSLYLYLMSNQSKQINGQCIEAQSNKHFFNMIQES
ncbi:oxidoreductase yciK [Candidatus Photodesmus katoptron]|nr:YciK family oxidoreductase [Candidatus Photodesmus katoptron]KEY90217.1 oxidoreductase yciK [Candidatus Photodesmus katoptron]